MSSYKISNNAKEGLIRIHQYEIKTFGEKQADKYIDKIFLYFEMISNNPFSFESIDHVRPEYRRCTCGVDSIYYKINDEIVEIMAIIGRQDLEITL